MTWRTTRDVAEFRTATAEHLAADPFSHSLLLTEAAYLAARPPDAVDQLYGWWQPDGGRVAGAFLRAPRHRPVLSLAPADALVALAAALPDLLPLDVDARSADAVRGAWRDRRGVTLAEGPRIRSYRLRSPDLGDTERFPGAARTATSADHALLADWYGRLLAAFPDDPTELAFLVDDPLGRGGATLWEVDGAPVGVAVRTRVVAGTVRVTAAYAPDDPAFAEAAFVAACVAAAEVADVVVVAGRADDADGARRYAGLGFEPGPDRVLLSVADGAP